ncbi:MAG: CoB--CoM heterodisulfide reductase iron-sulfur subunit B family protein [Hydrogenobaculum sp.]
MGVIGKNVAYYPGCSLEGAARAYDVSLRLVAKDLGLELDYLKDYNCCGAMESKNVTFWGTILMNARNMSLARKQGHEVIVAPCNGCSFSLQRAWYFLTTDNSVLTKTNALLREGGVDPLDVIPETYHALEWLYEEAGPEKIKEKTKKPLKGLKVANYYGCLYTRPHFYARTYSHAGGQDLDKDRPMRRATADDDEHPFFQNKLLEAAGATSVDFEPMHTQCCGGPHSLSDESVSEKFVMMILQNAKRNGADVIATECPLCHASLEMYRHRLMLKGVPDVDVPAVYFTQLLGLALGRSASEVKLKDNLSDPLPVLKRYGLA